MFKTRFADNEVDILIGDPVQRELMAKGINPIEVCRLVESFAGKILTRKSDDLIRITNDETGASLELEVKWSGEHQVSVSVSIVNLDNLTVKEQPKTKMNLADMIPPNHSDEKPAA